MPSQTEIQKSGIYSLYSHILIEYPEIYVQLHQNLGYLHILEKPELRKHFLHVLAVMFLGTAFSEQITS